MTTDTPGTLLRATLSLLAKETRSIEQIAQGSGLPFFWIRALKEGRSRHPGVNRIQRLYEFLSGADLAISFQPTQTRH